MAGMEAMAKKRISQQTFDETVRENIDDFEMVRGPPSTHRSGSTTTPQHPTEKRRRRHPRNQVRPWPLGTATEWPPPPRYPPYSSHYRHERHVRHAFRSPISPPPSANLSQEKDEALADAIQQFKSQGVDLTNIDTSGTDRTAERDALAK